MTELRAQVRSLESCPWYKGPKNSVKLASSGHGGNQEPGGASGRWCSACQRDTHDTASCWGPCSNCGKRGHLPEKCRNKPSDGGAAKKAKEAKEAKEAQEAAKAAKKKRRGRRGSVGN